MSEKAQEIIFDCVVVGAGIEGSCTARYSASLGKKTLCLEQFPLPHDRGSSHGQSRITRYSYEEDYQTNMMPEAFAMWADIERNASEKLFINCGCLTIDCPPYGSIKEMVNNLKSVGIGYELVNSQKLKSDYMLNFPNGFMGLLERTGGILLASKCLRAVQEQFVKSGGVLQDSEKVVEIIPGDIVQVKTNKGQYRTRSVILTPGPWATSLLKPLGIDLGLKPKRISVTYWKVKEGINLNASEKYPCWIDHSPYAEKNFQGTLYSVPCHEYPDMVKVCLHTGPDIDPDAREDVNHDWVERKVSEYIRRHVTGLETKPSIVEHCIYTVSPDEYCILDRHPKYYNIVMGVGFSGSGFKFAPVVGKILFQLAFGLEPSYDTTHFKANRFQGSIPKSSL